MLGSLRNRNPRLEIGRGVFKSLLLDSRDAHNMAAVSSAMSSSFLFRVGFRAKGNRFVEVVSVPTLCTAEAPEMGTIDLFEVRCLRFVAHVHVADWIQSPSCKIDRVVGADLTP